MNKQLEGVRGQRGATQARATCHDCEWTVDVPCQWDKDNNSGQKVKVNEAQAIKKLVAGGWTNVAKKLRCPACSQNSANKSADITTLKGSTAMPVTTSPHPSVEPNQTPTRAQKREIMAALTEAYDEAKQCYVDGYDDKTVSELADVPLHGWVAEIREEFFGPAELPFNWEKSSKELTDHDAQLRIYRTEVSDMLKVQKHVVSRLEEIYADVEKMVDTVGRTRRSLTQLKNKRKAKS